jgi:hypothetical protein
MWKWECGMSDVHISTFRIPTSEFQEPSGLYYKLYIFEIRLPASNIVH